MKILFAICLTMMWTGCYGYEVSVRTAPLSPGAYPPPNDRFIEVYFHDAGPAKTRAHEQICVIEVAGAKYTPMSELLFELRKKAGAIGADAVIYVSDQPLQRSAGNILADFVQPDGYQQEVYQSVRLSGIAVKFR